jgi:hypothetical protein
VHGHGEAALLRASARPDRGPGHSRSKPVFVPLGRRTEAAGV